MQDIEIEVHKQLNQILQRPHDERIDSSSHLFNHLGLTSLNLVVMMTNLCEQFKVDLFSLTEADLVALASPLDVIALFSEKGSLEYVG